MTLTLNNGVEMPALGFGVYQTPPAGTVEAVEAALRTGYRHIDTAAAYANEREVGEGIRRSGLDRSEGKLGVQIEMHPYFAQPDVLAADAAHGIVSQAWSPIGGITFYRGGGSSTLDDETIGGIATTHGRTPAQVMLRWHLRQGRSAIPKSTRPEPITLEAFGLEIPEA